MSTNKNQQEATENVFGFAIVDLKDYDMEEKSIHYIQLNHKTGKPKFVFAQAEENLRKAEFDFMVDIKILIQKISVYPNLLKLKVCSGNNEKERASEELSGFHRTHRTIRSTIYRRQNCSTQGLKKQMVNALHFGHQGLTEMLAEGNIIWWPGMRKDIKMKCSTCTACMISGKKLKYQLPMTRKSVYRY